ncbi:MAG: sulfotransferase [Bacteroidia bacterium]|nr:sulfotransferase [Bacteroidia bacterium]
MNESLRKFFRLETEIPPKVFPSPLFIAGCMRSGTSLLVDKISQHPQLLKVGMELNDIWTAIGEAPCVGYCEHRDESHASFAAAANMAHYFDRFVADARSLRRYLMRLSNLFRFGSGTFSYDWDHIIPVNKSPHLTNKIRYVHTLFPQSKIVLIIRSIEGHCASTKVFFDREYQLLKRVNYIPTDPEGCYTRFSEDTPPKSVIPGRHYPGDFSVIPEMWIRLNALGLRDILTLPADSFRIINYEDLVNRQPEVLQRLFDFLQLRSVHTAKAEKIKTSGLKVINTSTSGDPLKKWEKYLSSEEQEIIRKTIKNFREDFDFITQTLNEKNILAL